MFFRHQFPLRISQAQEDAVVDLEVEVSKAPEGDQICDHLVLRDRLHARNSFVDSSEPKSRV